MGDEKHESRAPKIHASFAFDGEVNSNTNDVGQDPTSFLEEKNELLEKYFKKIHDKLSTLELSINPESVPAAVKQVFVSVPTNIKLDVEVSDKKIVEVVENGFSYKTSDPNNKYKYCIRRFNDMINGVETMWSEDSARPLILRPYWKNGKIRNFLCLKPIDVISNNDCSIVLGGPGTGKSTLLKHLSLQLAKQYYSTNNILTEDTYSDFFFKHRYIPIYIQLRRFFGDKNGQSSALNVTTESLMEFVFGDDASAYISIFKKKKLIFFFDGIDEIFVGASTFQVIEQLRDAVVDFNPESKIVFSSRKESCASWQLDNCTSFELMSMDRSCRQLLAARVLKTYHPTDFDHKLEELVRQIDNSGLDEAIVGNPLFLSLMVVIYAVTGNLPTQKSLVLKESIRFLIKRWQIKIYETNTIDKFELEQLYSALKEIAAVSIEQRERNRYDNPLIISKEHISLVLDDLIKKNADASFVKATNDVGKRSQLFDCLVDSVGVIVPSHEKNKYEFAHRHFQEYLVASKLVEKSDLPIAMLAMASSNRNEWNEIFFMIMDVLFDEEDYSKIWSILQCFMSSDDEDEEACDVEFKAWKTWFCCKVVACRDYCLLKTVFTHKGLQTKSILARLNESTNLLIASTAYLPLIQRIDCARYIGEIKQKLSLCIFSAEADNFIKSLHSKLGDKRHGVGLDESGVPDIMWCKIPYGRFTMGTPDKEGREIIRDNPGSELSREQPCIELEVPSFYISKYPVTIEQFGAFINAGAYTDKHFWNWSEVSKQWFDEIGKDRAPNGDNTSNAPIVNICWIEAASFCIWLSEKTGKKIRMPFECEWERAAKLHFNRYSCSEDFDIDKYVSKRLGLSVAAPVGVCFCNLDKGMYPSDLTAGVWEWTQTLIPLNSETLKNYEKSYRKRNIKLPSDDINKDSRMVVRGGSFINTAFQSRNSYRGRDYIWNHITTRQSFRLAMEEE